MKPGRPLILLGLLLSMSITPGFSQTPPVSILGPWPQHSMERPRPKVVTPSAMIPTPPPPDAVILFDGQSLGGWHVRDSVQQAARWKVTNGYMEVVAGAGGIETGQGFGDVQLHLEWMTPNPPEGTGQDRGNSGVFLMERYEVQVLDSYQNDTYPDGQAGAIYGQYPPLVNASRAPGEWQSYDIVFHRPHFKSDGSLESPARITVLHNGILVQDNVTLVGPTSNQRRDPYVAHPDKLPLALQDHGFPVRFRNIWVRNLE
jgi:hypothetical protein